MLTGANYDGGSEGGGGNAGAGGDGAAGGAEGQFRNALIRIEQANGVVVGEAEVDDTFGMVKFALCAFDGPVKFTVRGKPDGSTTYFDESRGTPQRFPAGREVRSVVPSVTRNVGITPLTEGAYQYLLAKYGPDGWKQAANVREANEAIRVEVNRHLPADMQIEDISRLPVIVGSTSGTASGQPLDATKNGLYGSVLSGIAIAAGLFKTDSILPALEISEQLGKDLSDGRLDLFYCLNGAVADPLLCNASPVLGLGSNPAAAATYTAAQIAELINTGVSLAASRAGTAANANAAFRFTQVKIFLAPPAGQALQVYDDNSPIFLLRSDGVLYVWATRRSPLRRYATGFRQLYPQSRMLGSTYDGKVFADPVIEFPMASGAATISPTITEQAAYFGTSKIGGVASVFGTAGAELIRKQDGFAYTVQTVGGSLALTSTGRDNVLDVAATRAPSGGAEAYYTVLADGRVAAWTTNPTVFRTGNLGLAPSGSATPIAQTSPGPTTPTINPNLANIISVAANGFGDGAFAIERTGRVLGWGNAAGTLNSPFPIEVVELNQFGEIKQIQCAGVGQCIALTRIGEAIAWGNPGQGLPTPTYLPVKIALPTGRRAVYVGAADSILYGVLDDDRVFVVTDGRVAPQVLDPKSVTSVD